MQTQPDSPLADLGQRFLDYLPTLTAGLFVLALGLLVGWLAKRTVIRILIWLRLDRLGGRVSWRAAFGKGDVRAAIYALVGNVAAVLVVLLFLENALQIWGLTVLVGSIDALIRYLPQLVLVTLIVGVGTFLANTASRKVEENLEEEKVPNSRLAGKIVKATLLAIVCALALWQLGFAREIVLSAFLITFGAVGVAFALGVGLGSARAISASWEARSRRGKDAGEDPGEGT